MHLTEVNPAGDQVELHLCTTCIQQLGLQMEAGPPPIATILAQSVPGPGASAATAAGPIPATPADCPRCGMSFADFEAGKRFGCAHDYSAWEEPIASMLAGYHGADRHVGRRPGGGTGADQERDLRRAGLDAALRSAVVSEDYEQAARLRDELRQLEQP